MAKISYKLSIGWAGCSEEGELEVDDMTNEQINQMVWEMAQEHAASWEGDTRLMSEEEWDEERDNFYDNASGTWEFVNEECD